MSWLTKIFAKPATVATAQVVRVATTRQTPVSDSDLASLPQIPRTSDRYTNVSLGDLKYAKSPDELIKLLSDWDADVSAGIWNFIRVCSSGWTAVAYNKKQEPDDANQVILNEILLRLSLTNQYDTFNYTLSADQLAAQMLKSVLIRGAIAAELVPSKEQTVSDLVLVDPVRVNFKPDGKPFMKDPKGKEIKLDIPTFMWEVLDPDPGSPYEKPPFLAAINAVLFRISVMEDLQRVVKRTAFPRISVKVLEKTLRENAPINVKTDPKKLDLWLKQQMSDIATALANLKPEDAVVIFDSVEIGYLSNTDNPTVDFEPLFRVIDQQIVGAMKSLPTILGRNFSSSQTLSATESLMYTKSAKGVQGPVEKMMSRLLTLALLLEGKQGYVLFKYKPIELRPDSELSQHRAMNQALVLEQLSLGFITDTEAAERLTGTPTLPKTYKPLSGTGFYNSNAKAAADEVQQPQTPEDKNKPRAPRGGN